MPQRIASDSYPIEYKQLLYVFTVIEKQIHSNVAMAMISVRFTADELSHYGVSLEDGN
jgi:hypothetical protein